MLCSWRTSSPYLCPLALCACVLLGPHRLWRKGALAADLNAPAAERKYSATCWCCHQLEASRCQLCGARCGRSGLWHRMRPMARLHGLQYMHEPIFMEHLAGGSTYHFSNSQDASARTSLADLAFTSHSQPEAGGTHVEQWLQIPVSATPSRRFHCRVASLRPPTRALLGWTQNTSRCHAGLRCHASTETCPEGKHIDGQRQEKHASNDDPTQWAAFSVMPEVSLA